MLNTDGFRRYLGIQPEETRTVWLFFLHHFLLGIGTIQLYVAANAILLENHPESNLPLAYLASAVGMILVGKLYAYYEHHWGLSSVAIRVLWTVCIMTLLVMLVVWLGHSIIAAISIMVGYRVIYMLSSLEFWGVSAIVFDTRQGKRLFSIISSGDMPAKALGAVLAALVHAHADLLTLLGVSMVAFLGALGTLQLTLRSHALQTNDRHRAPRRVQPKFIEQLFGGSELVYFMCLSILTVACFATKVEYNFFMDVKHRFHDEATVIHYVSYWLAATYLLAMVVKVLASRRVLDRLGIQNSLRLLPAIALIGMAGVTAIRLLGGGEATLLIGVCLLYLLVEVIRRALFDAVFLVLFQPLTPHQRLKGHTLAKAVYEPIGLGIAGIFLFLANRYSVSEILISSLWLLVPLATLLLVRRTYRFYLNTLGDALAKRFMPGVQVALPGEIASATEQDLQSTSVERVRDALDWIAQQQPEQFWAKAKPLLSHSDAIIRMRILEAFSTTPIPADFPIDTLLKDTDSQIREKAARLSMIQGKANASLLNSSDVAIRKGAIQGSFEGNTTDTEAHRVLTEWYESPKEDHRKMALEIIGHSELTEYTDWVERSLNDARSGVIRSAIRAAGSLNEERLYEKLFGLITHREYSREVLKSIREGRGEAKIRAMERHIRQAPEQIRIIAQLLGHIHTPHSQQLLLQLAGNSDRLVRETALHSLRHFKNDSENRVFFETLLNEEMALAEQLASGIRTAAEDTEWQAALSYEMERLLKRLLRILALLYDPEALAHIQTGLMHSSHERKANALEMLENLVPRSVYSIFRSQFEMASSVQTLQTPEEMIRLVLEEGPVLFTEWTISVALRRWKPSLGIPNVFIAYQNHSVALVKESARIRANELPNFYHAMSAHTTAETSPLELLRILKKTPLFKGTAENVLATILPIMKTVHFAKNEVIIRKGDLGDSMFIIGAGEVGIFDNDTLLAEMGEGDLFGELALLDAEPRSATVIAQSKATLFRIDQEDFYDLMEERGEVLRNVMRVLCQRIRHQNEVVRNQSRVAE